MSNTEPGTRHRHRRHQGRRARYIEGIIEAAGVDVALVDVGTTGPTNRLPT